MERVELESGRVWCLEGEKSTTYGVTDLAVSELGEVSHLEPADRDEPIRKGDVLFTIEGSTGSVEFKSPVDGTVTEVNESVVSEPQSLSDDPYDACWVIRVETTKSKTE